MIGTSVEEEREIVPAGVEEEAVLVLGDSALEWVMGEKRLKIEKERARNENRTKRFENRVLILLFFRVFSECFIILLCIIICYMFIL